MIATTVVASLSTLTFDLVVISGLLNCGWVVFCPGRTEEKEISHRLQSKLTWLKSFNSLWSVWLSINCHSLLFFASLWEIQSNLIVQLPLISNFSFLQSMTIILCQRNLNFDIMWNLWCFQWLRCFKFQHRYLCGFLLRIFYN